MINIKNNFIAGAFRNSYHPWMVVGNKRFCATMVIGFLFAVSGEIAWSANPASVLPRDKRDTAITTPEEFFGFQVGSRHLRHDQLTAYMTNLAEESDRVTLRRYATSHGGRDLFVLVITSPDNHQRIGAIKKSRQRIASGMLVEPAAGSRSVMYFGYGVHGDEASALNASPLVAYHLASSLSQEVAESLDRSVFLLDPSLNPDGGARFAHWVNENRGRLANPDPQDREHQQYWPRGRTNYYWFDLNRDWLPAVHPESQGRLELFHTWKPNVVLDFHEMGSSSSYFFQPGVRARTNPFTPRRNVELTKEFALSHAKYLDAAGELFFTEEKFDDFYIGKGSTYPDVNGSVGILFEQGSSRGLSVKTSRTRRSFADSIANQIRTSLSSLEAFGRLSEELLQFQCDFFKDALSNGGERDSYLLIGESSRIAAVQALLRRHDIEVHSPSQPILMQGKVRKASEVLFVPSEQPQSTLIQSMMSTEQLFQENIFYDVSTWHVPSSFDLEVAPVKPGEVEAIRSSFGSGEKVNLRSSQPVRQRSGGKLNSWAFDKRNVGFALPPTSLNLPKLIAALQEYDTKLRVTSKPFKIELDSNADQYPEGTLLILKQPNEMIWSEIVKILRQHYSEWNLKPTPITSSMTASGPDLGSDTTINLVKANPALLVGQGTNSYTAGSLWHHLDVRVGQMTTLLDTSTLHSASLEDYSVVIMPDGDYGSLGDRHGKQLKNYLENGGVVVSLCNSIDWLKDHGVVSDSAEVTDSAPHAVTVSDKHGQNTKRFGDARDNAALKSIAGALFQTKVDSTHPLAFGFPDEQVPVFRRGTYRFPLPKNSYQTAAVYGDVIAGYVSVENREKLEGTAAVFVVPVGKGRIIVLADNPVFRGYMRSTAPFLTNAIYLGPSFQLPRSSNDEHGHQH